MKIVSLHTSAERQKLANAVSLPSFSANQMDECGVDVHLCAITESGEVHAHCSLWWNTVPAFGAHKVGVIGHFASTDDDSASVLMNEAVSFLRRQACTIAIGPMDGNTWRHYRFVTERGVEEPFFLEPSNPPEWPVQFERAGFTPLAEYFSALNTNLALRDERAIRHAMRLADRGVRIRTAEGEDLQQLLGRIYNMSCISFTQNFLYTELPEDAFRAQYAKILPYVRPELVLLAERDSKLVGYLFAIPDLTQAAHGAAIDTFLIKTVAILPDAELRGLGSVLVAHAHEQGLGIGYCRCIHALMHESNISRNISGHFATTMRRYAIYGREISS
jgi:GNAT superfamily N-acetyltransferase